MGNPIDLTLPIFDGQGRFELKNKFETPYTLQKDGWQGSVFQMFAHTGTHVDAPVHFLDDGATIDQLPLETVVGRAILFDFSDAGPSDGIDARELGLRDPGLGAGDIAVLRTDWTDKHWGSERFVRESPYLTVDGAGWLIEHGVKAIVYDFSEEYIVREPGFDGRKCEIHHRLFTAGVWNIEYVCNLRALHGPVVTIFALPLILHGLDGAPARVIAYEGELDTT